MPALQYDGLITIATGSSRRSASWKTKEMLWSEFVDKLGRVTRTQETQQEYFRMPKEERDNAKDVGGFVGGTLKGGRRKIDAVLQRRLITLDMDSVHHDWYFFVFHFLFSSTLPDCEWYRLESNMHCRFRSTAHK